MNQLKGCYPIDIFINISEILPFICPIDKGVVKDPYSNKNSIIYGKNCLINSKDSLSTSFYPDIQTSNKIGQFQIKCYYYKCDCKWIGMLSELENHLKNQCLFCEIPCLFDFLGCKEMLTRNNCNNHLIYCHYEEIFKNIKKYEALILEKEKYEKWYKDLLASFYFVNSQRIKKIEEIQLENENLKKKINDQENNENKKTKNKEQNNLENNFNEILECFNLEKNKFSPIEKINCKKKFTKKCHKIKLINDITKNSKKNIVKTTKDINITNKLISTKKKKKGFENILE